MLKYRPISCSVFYRAVKDIDGTRRTEVFFVFRLFSCNNLLDERPKLDVHNTLISRSGYHIKVPPNFNLVHGSNVNVFH